MGDSAYKKGTFPDTFLDYIPDPSMGKAAYREKLEQSFAKDSAEVPPVYALLKVTERCSSLCIYCAHAGVTDATGETTTEELEDVLDQFAEIGVVSVNLTGGEPLQRDDLPHLSRYARQRGLFPILLTNGLLLRHRIEELASAELGMVIVSVDSVCPESYRATRGVNLRPVLEGIEALRELGDKAPAITVTVVINENNINDLEATVEYFSSRQIGVKLSPYHHHGRWEDDQTSPQNREQYIRVVNRLKELKEMGAGVINSHAYLDNFVPFTFDKRALPQDYRCYCGYTTLYIDSKLNVRSCWSYGLPIAGNLRERRLKDLLSNQRLRIMRKKIRKLQCERCWFLCTGEISLRWQ
jgi:radical SAM protein with 4Fe4S-binding SPASM domain